MAGLQATAGEWSALSALLDEALDLPPDDRARWIDSLPREHDPIRHRLRRLLIDDAAEADSFLQTIPKIDVDSSCADALRDAGAPEMVTQYRILRKLSEGGMGTVWLAHRTDVMVNRLVALKLPRHTRGAGLADRMAEEREILAALDHPNIARLYDAGLTSDGHPYLALEYVAGRPIDEYVKATQLPIHARLRLFLMIARAVAHAHGRLVVHRDLKPSNILVTDEGDVKLLDFGIAKLLAAGGTLERDAAASPLTLDYASPEQIAREPLGVATDVFSSGVVLYELLTGVRPYARSRSRLGIVKDPALDAPKRPSDAVSDPSIRRTLSGDLDSIVLKALEPRPDARYATIDALADDIDRFLNHYPVAARPGRAAYRMSKCLARHTVAVVAAAAVFVAILGGTAVSTWQAHAALTEKARALEVRDVLIALFRDASPYNAGGRALSALDWLKQVRDRVDRRLDDRPELRVELLNIVGTSLLNLQDTASAEEVLDRAVQESTLRLGPLHPETLRARVLMIPVHRFRGRTKQMRGELEILLPVLRAQRDSQAEYLAIALKNQAHLEIDEGRYAEADRAAQEAVDVARASLGEGHPETVAAYLICAFVYQRSRSADAALKAAESAYRLAVSVFRDTPRHPRTIEGRLVYGRALGAAGEVVRGVEHVAEAVRDAAEVFGPSSRMVGLYSLSLAELQLKAGLVGEALENSERGVDIISKHTDPRSFRYADAIHQRGAALLAAGRAADALPDLSRAADTLRQILAEGHDLTRQYEADEALARWRTGSAAPKPAPVNQLAGSGTTVGVSARLR